jgi:hypothetical protein
MLSIIAFVEEQPIDMATHTRIVMQQLLDSRITGKERYMHQLQGTLFRHCAILVVAGGRRRIVVPCQSLNGGDIGTSLK